MGVRVASKAGTWYSDDPAVLARELDRFLRVVDVSDATPLLAGIVPHAGLAFSGPTAARVFARLRACRPRVGTLLVFGAVHTVSTDRPVIWAEGAWETPLGCIEVDDALAQALVEAGVGVAGTRPHMGDNAIELQTPFIRHCFPEARIVPIATPPSAEAADAGTEAFHVVQAMGADVVVLGSTDLTHYGHDYGFAPVGTGDAAHAWSKANDRTLIEHMLELNAEAVVPTAQRDRSACGAGAVAATVAYARAAGCTRGELLEHTTSYEIMPQSGAGRFVGYGAVVFPVAD